MAGRPTYVGVTGFMAGAEVKGVLNCERLSFGPDDPKLMVGVLVSQRTMRGEPGKFPGRYPAIEAIDKIFPRHPRALNLIHFSTQDPSTLAAQLKELTERVDSTALHGFQLNIAWPHVGQLEKLFDQTGRWEIVLQVGSKAFADAGNDPKEVAKRAASYGDLIRHVLLDGSGGLGIPLDGEQLLPFVDALYEALPETRGVGVAGGLCFDAVAQGLLEDLLTAHPDLSIDAEGKVRNKTTDALVVDKAISFLDIAARERSNRRSLHALRKELEKLGGQRVPKK